ncbi:MAG: hypothetical protein COV67_02885 [Nitrospinae bacterium CG11_big_fil_rev_8_21_14_0_20_56_8]|nr:MAG: hypothetical protein COV67_02885 [Nitrospinae bacterium CG11_big_fil_rev_8_21_14_0_20_56_8]
MFVFDPIIQGLGLLAQRELQRAENVFLKIINDPYAQKEELNQARALLNDIRDCQAGRKNLDFDVYKKLAKKSSLSLEIIDDLLAEIYFSPLEIYADFDEALAEKVPTVVSRLKQIKIRDVIARDELFVRIEKNGSRTIRKLIEMHVAEGNGEPPAFKPYRWKTIYRKFIEHINPILLERHLELLEYILETGEISLLDDPKLTVLTAKYRWIIESTLYNKWYLLRSYFFKARSDIENQFGKKEGTRKYWDEVRYKKIRIFEKCGFTEQNIQKFLYIDKLNYKTLEEIFSFARDLGQNLVPRDVSLALRGVDKAKDHIKERGGFLLGTRKRFQDQLIDLGFSGKESYLVAHHAKRSNNQQIADAFHLSLKVAREEIYWYRIPEQHEKIRKDIIAQCCKHLSTVRIHLFDRGRLNKLLLQSGKPLIRKYLIQIYGEGVVGLHCYFRLETIHQYYKLKFFQYHAPSIPSVSELIKISRKEFQFILQKGFAEFMKKRRLVIPDGLLKEMECHRSVTNWEDPYTTVEEKFLLRFWFLMDHGVPITQAKLNKGILRPGMDLWNWLKRPGQECQV